MPKDQKENISSELADIREILGTIVKHMVTKEEFNDVIETVNDGIGSVKEDLLKFQEETRRNFNDVRSDIAELKKETEFEFEDLLGRVKYVEQKLGIESGK
jgi:gas vesicle protein